MVETHHRVKNNLQIIASLVDMQTAEKRETIPLKEFERLVMHIRTLATVHDLLTHQAKEDKVARTIPARAMLTRLLAAIGQAAGQPALESRIADAPLTARQGTALSIVANELVSNALKHGRGKIEITFETRDDRAVLEVCDDGPGFAPDFDPIRASSAGLERVDSLSRYDLGGEARYQNRTSGGAQARVSFAPAP